MTREEPSLETLWLKNIGTMDKVQKIDRSNPLRSSAVLCAVLRFRPTWFSSVSPFERLNKLFKLNTSTFWMLTYSQFIIIFPSYSTLTILWRWKAFLNNLRINHSEKGRVWFRQSKCRFGLKCQQIQTLNVTYERLRVFIAVRSDLSFFCFWVMTSYSGRLVCRCFGGLSTVIFKTWSTTAHEWLGAHCSLRVHTAPLSLPVSSILVHASPRAVLKHM
jgi:hypothetical protein